MIPARIDDARPSPAEASDPLTAEERRQVRAADDASSKYGDYSPPFAVRALIAIIDRIAPNPQQK